MARKPQPLAPKPAPAVSLAEAREYFRVIGREDDARIATLIGAATATVQRDTRLQLSARRYRWTFTPCDPYEIVTLRPAPLASVESLTAIHADDTEEAVDLADFEIDTETQPGTIEPKRRKYWPAADCFRIEYTSGAAIVPDDLRLLVMSLALHWFEAPEAAGEANLKTTPLGYEHQIRAIDPHGDALR